MSAAPLELRSDAASRTLTLRWADGRLGTLAHAALRDACPCAGCRARRLAGEPVVTHPEVSVTDIRPMGYGVQLVFDDGHDRGIFPWPFLAALAAA
ncbi:gamma-butyrobetaine hydroxylase-like domain-containing protein [Burkholderia sp. 22PA0099]|uniref:gamma-butyrobetaine hydroxylase-like domain-containing protein n=1 Tax=Burkholderia sp. 22PA0099 TaxID=3237372 RepID=UPI0039C42919